jgi:drug/metabolite transporter (DMT)-like permease
MASSPSQFRLALGFAAVYFIWGSTFLAIRYGVEGFPPFLFSGIRFTTAGLLFYALMRLRGAAAPERRHWRSAVVIGALMPAGGTGLVTWAEQTVPSGIAALLVATGPLFIVMIDGLRPNGTHLPKSVLASLGLGFVGVVVLLNPARATQLDGIDLVGSGVALISALSWAFGAVYAKGAPQPGSRLLAVGMQMTAAGVVLLATGGLMGEHAQINLATIPVRSWLGLAYLIVVGSLGFCAYMWLLSVSTLAKVSTHAYINPVVALALGSLIAGEALGIRTLVSATMVILAVAVIITRRTQTPPPRETCNVIVPQCATATCHER